MTSGRAACAVILSAWLGSTAPLGARGQTPPIGPPPAPTAVQAAPDPETQESAAPVLLEGEPIVWILTGAGPYTAEFRAERIAQRLLDAVHDRTIRDPTVTTVEVEGSTEIRVGPRLLMIITQKDAAALGMPRAALALQYAHEFENAIRNERVRYAPATLLRSGLYGALATLLFAAAVWIIMLVSKRIGRAVVGRLVPASESLRAMQEELLADRRVGRTMVGATRAVRAILILLLFDVYLTYVLGLFPWTRAVSLKLIAYALTPVRAVGEALVGYLPNLLFLLVIVGVIYFLIRMVGIFFRYIEEGRLVFKGFPAEWAGPTNKIARVLLIAFGLVVAFPYLPASDSPAFAGVSVFMGVLFSLASSSALSNMIAGIVLTYTSAFRIGDRVKVGDAMGDITEMAMLVTRVRTIKHEEITIPNSLVLGSSVTNYSRHARGIGLILHTSVTIGYDAPWRKIHDLLISAALATPRILTEPKPFVWQTALNDFYVTYEINAYTASPQEMVETYADLHARIQDEFYAAGVEIMSPHYTSLRDGNTVAIPEALRAPDYKPGAFRVAGKPNPV